MDNDGDLDAIFSQRIAGQFRGSFDIVYYENDEGNYLQRTGIDNPFDSIQTTRYATLAFADLDEDGDQDMYAFESQGYGVVREYINQTIPNNDTVITSVSDHINDGDTKFKFYPNPAKDKIFVSDGLIQIFDIEGKEILSKESNGLLDISNLRKGVYFIRKGQYRTKLIKE